MNAVRTKEQEEYVSSQLTQIFQNVVTMDKQNNKSATPQKPNQKRNLASLNPVNCASDQKRQTPVNSPSRLKNRQVFNLSLHA